MDAEQDSAMVSHENRVRFKAMTPPLDRVMLSDGSSKGARTIAPTQITSGSLVSCLVSQMKIFLHFPGKLLYLFQSDLIF